MKSFKVFLVIAMVLTVSGINFLPQAANAWTPSLTSAVFIDNDHNGRIDRVKVTFDFNVTSCKFEVGDWPIAPGSVGLTGPTSRLNGSGVNADCDGSTNYFYLIVFGNANETGYPGTYVPADIQYRNQGFLNDVLVSGVAVPNQPIMNIDDNATPVLRSDGTNAPTYSDSDHNGTVDQLRLTFTEAVNFTYNSSDWAWSAGDLTGLSPVGYLSGSGSSTILLNITANANITGVGAGTAPTIRYAMLGTGVQDKVGNPMAGMGSGINISDGASPVMISTVPTAGATDVSVTTSFVRVTFSEPMSTSATSLSISSGSWLAPSWSDGNKTVSRSRLTTLPYDTNVTVTANGEDTSGYLLTSGASPAITNPWSFRTTVDPALAVSASQSTVSASPTSVAADGSSVSVITVTAKNSSGSALSGKTVTLSSNRGATDTIAVVNGTTDASGKAYFQARSNTAGSAIFTAVADGTTISQTAIVTFTATTPTLGPVSASRSSLYATPSSVTANNSSYSVVYVTVRDATDNLLSGKTVTLSSSRGSSDSITIVSGTTNSSGQATFQVKSGSVGTATLTAVADGTSITQTAAVTFTAVTPTLGPVSASRSSIYATPSSVTANNSSYATIYVTVRDASDNLLSGKTVTLSSSRGSSDSITIVSGTTNSSGQATFQVKSGSVGTATLTAVADGTSITQTAAVTFTSSGLSLIYGDLFKESGSTAVYYYADNGKRYVFPTSAIYFSWYSDFSTIKTVSHETVTSVSFGGNVIVKPGTYLVQFVSMDTPFRVLDPKVYVLTSAGQLRWITSASVATSFYGADWERKIIAVPEVYKTNYGGAVAGADVNSTADYSKVSVEATVRTISDLY